MHQRQLQLDAPLTAPVTPAPFSTPLPSSPAPAVHAAVLLADGHGVLGAAAHSADVSAQQRVYCARRVHLLCIAMAQLTVLAPAPAGYNVAVCSSKRVTRFCVAKLAFALPSVRDKCCQQTCSRCAAVAQQLRAEQGPHRAMQRCASFHTTLGLLTPDQRQPRLPPLRVS